MSCVPGSSSWAGRLLVVVGVLLAPMGIALPASAQSVCAIAPLTVKGWSAYRAGDMVAAREAFAAVQEQCPELAEPQVGLGYVELRGGHFATARAHFEAALDRTPDHADAVKGLARVEARMGRIADSENHWRSVIDRNPTDVEALVGLGRTARWQGRLADAGGWLEQAQATDPNSADLREEFQWLAASKGPVLTTRLIVEGDSDGNRMLTSLGSARWVVRDGLEIRWDGYHRSTTLSGERTRRALGHIVSTRTFLSSGWSVQGGLGGSETNVLGTGVKPSGFLGVTSPAGRSVESTLEIRSVALDVTTQTIERSVARRAINLSVAVRPSSEWSGSLAASAGEYDGAQSNGFWRLVTEVSRQQSAAFRLGPRLRGFGFARDAADGYFDPSWFVAADLPLRWERTMARVAVEVQVAPGVQRTAGTESFEASFSSAVTGRARFRPGRELWISAGWARSGAERFTSGAGSYRYASFTAGGAWVF